MKNSLFFSALLLLSACGSAPVRNTYYDFGPALSSVEKMSEPDCQLPPVYLADISVPPVLGSDLMQYRLLYINAQQSGAYANYRWRMTPAQLLKQRIKMQLARQGVTLIDNGIRGELNQPAPLQLRLELTDFTQYFSDATSSYSQIQIRASLIRTRKVAAQTILQQQTRAETADARGGALAMRSATDMLISDLTQWLCKQVQP